MPTPVVSLSPLQMVTPVIVGPSNILSVDSSVLPITVNADLNTTRLEISIYNTTTVVTAFTASGGFNVFTTAVPLVPTVQEATVQIVGRNYNPFGAWANLTAFATGYTFVDPNGNVQVASVGGVSGNIMPVWNLTVGGTTSDGSGLSIVTWTNLGPLAITSTVKFTLIFFQSNLAVQIGPPSAIQAKMNQSDCTLQWATPSFTSPDITFLGVRVMLSTDPAGINPPYTQYGNLVTGISSSVNTIIDSETTTNVNGNTTIVTTTQTTMPTNYSTVDVPQSFFGTTNQFYALFSTVIQDSASNAVYESQQNGPLTCGFVNLKVVNPTDFPVLQRQQDIAGRIIAQIMRQQPNLDLSPRSEIRDTLVDPVAAELSNMSVREWFARVSTSISGISQVDDANGDGVSDSFNTSPYKQQIARAYGLNPGDTQSLIDTQFNILGEQAGLTRGGATTATTILTFYTYTEPTQNITIQENATVATIADQNTPALNFITRGSAVLDVSNLNSYYNAVQGWWAVTVPAECATSGSIGNVGAGTIRSIVNGLPAGINVTNLVPATFGSDSQSNSQFAALIQARTVTGVDTGTRHGYQVTALQTPGIVSATIVAAGDVDMLRDWDPIRQKHVFGCVDIYVSGTTLSQQNESVTFTYGTTGIYGNLSTYLPLTLSDPRVIRFNIPSFGTLTNSIYTGVELLVNRAANSFYLGLERAQFDNVGGNVLVNPNDMAYQYVGSTITAAKIPLLINGTPATNLTAVAYLASVAASTYSYGLFARYQSPLLHTPTLQPVISVDSVIGEATETGTINPALVQLIYTSDFLLEGGSQNAGDQVNISTTATAVAQATINAQTATLVQIDTAMSVPINATGVPGDVLSVRSNDLSTLYKNGIDYNIVSLDNYRTYGLQVLTSSVPISAVMCSGGVLTVTVNNEFGVGAQITLSGITDPIAGPILNGQIVTIATVTPTQFTASFATVIAPTSTTGLATGSAIQNNQSVVVAYNKYVVYERPTLITGESQILTGNIPNALNNAFSFVHNVWLPESYSPGAPPAVPFAPDLYHTLTLDGWDGLYNTTDGGLDIVGSAAASAVIIGGVTIGYTTLVGASVPYLNRYIKVTYNNGVSNIVMLENLDFTLAQNSTTGAWQISRILGGRIPDGATVTLSYWATETFTLATQYPAFVQILANQIAITKHAAADVLIKAMVASPVDITMTVTLQANASPEAIDAQIRTAISIVLDNANGTLFQSELIAQVQAITGVKSVAIPLIKCAKSNGSYDIGVVIPTGTTWIPLSSDPAFTVAITALQCTGGTLTVTTKNTFGPGMTVTLSGIANTVAGNILNGQTVTITSATATSFTAPFPTTVAATTTTGIASVATPEQSYITASPVLPDSTIPSGGEAQAIVDLLYQGQIFRRATSIQDFLTNSPAATTIASTQTPGSFYIFGDNDQFNVNSPIPASYEQKIALVVPDDVVNPGNLSYFVTYQVFDEGGAKDITVSSTEYLTAGNVVINYITTGS